MWRKRDEHGALGGVLRNGCCDRGHRLGSVRPRPYAPHGSIYGESMETSKSLVLAGKSIGEMSVEKVGYV